MKILLTILISFFWIGNAFADACGPFGCMFQPGTVCVDGKCVPKTIPGTTATTTTIKPSLPFFTTTTTPPSTSTTTTTTTLPGSLPTKPKQSHIQQKAVPMNDIVPLELSCRKYDSLHLIVDLMKFPPAEKAYFYSAIFYPNKMFVAHRDINGSYVFIETALDESKRIPYQSHGPGLQFFLWRNPAFGDLLRLTPCSDWVDDKVVFTYGISYKEDMSDWEGASFKFVP